MFVWTANLIEIGFNVHFKWSWHETFSVFLFFSVKSDNNVGIKTLEPQINKPSTLQAKITGLQPDHAYRFFVWARTSAGKGIAESVDVQTIKASSKFGFCFITVLRHDQRYVSYILRSDKNRNQKTVLNIQEAFTLTNRFGRMCSPIVIRAFILWMRRVKSYLLSVASVNHYATKCSSDC